MDDDTNHQCSLMITASETVTSKMKLAFIPV